jgi:hypothetical protein
MGVNYDGVDIPSLGYHLPLDFVILFYCMGQFLFFTYHTLRLFRTEATTRLSLLFRTLFLICWICTTTQSIHFLTPGHPLFHWIGGTGFGVLLSLVTVCELQILKLVSRIHPKRITMVQILWSIWSTMGFLLSCVFLGYLGRPAPTWLLFMQRYQFQSFVLIAVVYETWHILYISFLIVRRVQKVDRNAVSEPVHHKNTTPLLVLLVIMIVFLWSSIAIWLYAYTFPAITTPMETCIRIVGNQIGLCYPFLMDSFWQRLKSIQFAPKISAAKAIRVSDRVSETTNHALEPTRIMRDSQSNT